MKMNQTSTTATAPTTAATQFTMRDDDMIAEYSPAEGLFSTDRESYGDTKADLETALSKKYGFKIHVTLYSERGHEILGDMPSSGLFLANRK